MATSQLLSHLRVCVCWLSKVRTLLSDPKKDQALQKYLYRAHVSPKRTSEKVWLGCTVITSF